jgi:hypothetical protein
MRLTTALPLAVLLGGAAGWCQIIANGDMEQGGAKTAAGWSTNLQTGTYEFTPAGGARSGRRCLAVRCTGPPGWARWYTTDVFLVEGATYHLSFWVRTEADGLSTVWLLGGGAEVRLTAANVPTWTHFERDFTTTASGRAGLYLQNEGGGAVYYDDVEVKMLKPRPAAASGEVPTNGAPLVAIVVPDEAGPVPGYLAGESRRLLKEITGQAPPIAPVSAAPPGRCLYLGVSPPGTDYRSDLKRLTEEGLLLDVGPSAIVCLGGSPRGLYYATHEFFHLLGCRWVMPEGPGECLPRLARLEVPKRKIIHNPYFALRGAKTVQVYHYPPEMKSRHVSVEPWVDWAARNRMNALKASYPWTWDYGTVRGGQWSEWSGHTLYHALPPEQHFAAHPEYYPLVGRTKGSPGQRTHVHSSGRANQVCVSHPEVARLIADVALEFFAGNPEARRFGLCAEDEPCCWCECDACRALDTQPVDWSKNGLEGLPMTDRWLFLVNRVADLVAARYPDRIVHTFAYASTSDPPRKQLPHRNVQIELTWWSRCF